MKNKKLFAILTLVCFMMTLMPVAAFAATVPAVTADGKDNAVINVAGSVDLNVTTGSATGFFAVAADGTLYKLFAGDATAGGTDCTVGATGFTDPGTYKVYAIKTGSTLVDTLAGATGDTMTKAEKLTLLMESDYLVDDYAVVKVKAPNVEYRILLADNNTPANATFNSIGTNEYEIDVNANDGWSEDGAILATLETSTDGGSTWTGVKKGAELTFTKAGFVNVATEDAVTDRGGNVEFEVSSDRVGSYVVYVNYGTFAKAKLNVHVTAAAYADIATETVPTAPAAYGTPVSAVDVEFKVVDANGIAYAGSFADTTDYKVTVVSKPADSYMTGSDFALVPEGSGIWSLTTVDGSGTPTLAPFDAEGTYVIKVTLKNGQSTEATVKVARMGEPVAIKFVKVPATVLYIDGGVTKLVDTATPTNKARVVAVDANGVTSDVTFNTEFSATGKAFTSFAVAKSSPDTLVTLDMRDRETYIGSTITLYAVYGEFTTSQTITVTDDATTVKYAKTTGEVGVSNTFYGNIVDVNGKTVRLNDANGVPNAGSTVIVLEKPENAIVSASLGNYGAKGLEVNFLGSVAGDYKLQTVVIDDAGKYITSIDTFTLGATEGTFKDVIVLSIGSNNMIKNGDVNSLLAAPEIKDGRTMIPMRAGLEAFGATVNWDEANRTVTAEMNGVKVVMTVDSLDYTVNGKAMKADSAPYIKNGSTMVPAVFFTNAFGIVATPLYDANGVCDVLFSK